MFIIKFLMNALLRHQTIRLEVKVATQPKLALIPLGGGMKILDMYLNLPDI
jgi:hypothetical protein